MASRSLRKSLLNQRLWGVISVSALLSIFLYYYWARDFVQLSFKFGRFSRTRVVGISEALSTSPYLTTTASNTDAPATSTKGEVGHVSYEPVKQATSDLLVNDDLQAWIHVKSRKILVHSAYLDTRVQPAKVRVLVTLGCGDSAPLYCRIIVSGNKIRWTNSTITLINSGCSTIYEGHYVTCDSIEPFIPAGVQLFSNSDPSEGLLKTSVISEVIQRSARQNQTEMLGVCVGRTFDWHDWVQVLFFIEFYLGQGAAKVVFYHRSWSPDVHLLLKTYEADGLVDVLSWPPVPKIFHNTEDPGRGTDLNQQNLNLNDCSWWLMGRMEYVLVVDVDELVMPRKVNESLVDLLRRWSQKYPATGAFKFLNLQSHSPWPELKPISQVFNSFDQFFDVFFQESFYSKLVCTTDYLAKSAHKPLSTFRVSQHDVHEMLRPATVDVIPSEEAVKLHLRKFHPNGKPELLYRESNRPCVSTDQNQYEKKPNVLGGLRNQFIDRATKRLAKVIEMQKHRSWRNY